MAGGGGGEEAVKLTILVSIRENNLKNKFFFRDTPAHRPYCFISIRLFYEEKKNCFYNSGCVVCRAGAGAVLFAGPGRGPLSLKKKCLVCLLNREHSKKQNSSLRTGLKMGVNFWSKHHYKMIKI